MTTLKIYKTHPAIQLPKFATEQSACFDISFYAEGKVAYKGFNKQNASFERSLSKGNITIVSGDRIMVPTGLILDIPIGYSVRLHPRSGLSLKQGLVLANAQGIIDSDYVEELFVLMYNMSDNVMTINNGDRICQGELIKTDKYTIEETLIQPKIKTDRKGGMGSTGVKNVTEN